jgi:hypothetical protein
VNYRDFDVVLFGMHMFGMHMLAIASQQADPAITIKKVVAPTLSKLKTVLDVGHLVMVWLWPPSKIIIHPQFEPELHALLRSFPLPVDCIEQTGPKIIPQAQYFREFLEKSGASFRYNVA